MKIFYKSEAVKKLKKLGPAEKNKAKRKIEIIYAHPLVGKKLKGEFKDLRSFRAWPVRIIYSFNHKTNTLTIITVDYRGSVYKK